MEYNPFTSKGENFMPRATLKSYHFEIHRRKSHFWSVIKSSNHKTIWTSKTYTTKQNAVIPCEKLASAIGVRKCSFVFIDHNKKGSENVKPKRTRPVKNP